MGRAIVITSGKGGTGKTTSTAAIASSLAALGYKTLCLDCDVGLKNLDLSLGLSDLSVMDFADVLSGDIELSEAVTAHPAIDGLFFLSAPSHMYPEDIRPEDMKELISRIKDEYDYCIIDCPAGLGAGFRLAVSNADAAIVVATGDAASLRDGQRVVAELMSFGIDDIRLLVNRVRPRLFKRMSETVDDIIDAVGARLIGLISEDDDVILAGSLEKPLILYRGGKAARQFLDVSRRITGQDVPLGRIR